MSLVKYFGLFCIIFAPSSLCLDICGLEAVPRCSFVEVPCLVNLEYQIRKWFQTPQAETFLIKPLDPLQVDEIVTIVGTKVVTLKDVGIKGIPESPLSLDVVAIKGLFSVYTHNLTVTASKYSVKDLVTGETTEKDDLVVFALENAKTANQATLKVQDRCDGNTYLDVRPAETYVTDGQATLVSGLVPSDYGIDSGDLELEVLEKVAKLSTEELHNKEIELFGIIPYEVFFTDKEIYVPLLRLLSV